MTSPEESVFCFPKTLNVPRGEAEGTIDVEPGKQNAHFPSGLVIKCFVIPPNSKIEKYPEEIVCFTPSGSQICRGSKEHNLIAFEWKFQVLVFLGS